MLQAFDAHGKEEKLAPGVYNLVRIMFFKFVGQAFQNSVFHSETVRTVRATQKI